MSRPLALMLALSPAAGLAAEQRELLDLTNHWAGCLGVAVLVIACLLVMTEEFTHLRKSKSVILAAGLMHFAVPDAKPHATEDRVIMQRGARRIIGPFLLTIATTVSFHNLLHLPPVIGMLTGMGYLGILGYHLKRTPCRQAPADCEEIGELVPFDVLRPVARAAWDTPFFFYGVVACVGALCFMGYLAVTSQIMYDQWDANIAIGILSAVVDNIPVMFAVSTMQPDMSLGQRLLVTLTAGVGGSLLSVGSAAGVAPMGQARGVYTFSATCGGRRRSRPVTRRVSRYISGSTRPASDGRRRAPPRQRDCCYIAAPDLCWASSMSDFLQRAEELVEAGSFLYAQGMVPATSGNFSARLADGSIAVTVSGRHKGRLTTADIMRVDRAGHSLDGRRPSAETLLHTHVYARFPRARFVLHPHSVTATVLSLLCGDTLVLQDYELLKAFPEVVTHDCSIEVPVFDNDQDIGRLAEAVDGRLAARCDAPGYLLRGHGFYTWGESIEDTLRHVEAFEFLFACEMRLRDQQTR